MKRSQTITVLSTLLFTLSHTLSAHPHRDFRRYNLQAGDWVWIGNTQVVCHPPYDAPVASIRSYCSCEVPPLGGSLKTLVRHTVTHYDSTRFAPRWQSETLGTFSAAECEDNARTWPACR